MQQLNAMPQVESAVQERAAEVTAPQASTMQQLDATPQVEPDTQGYMSQAALSQLQEEAAQLDTTATVSASNTDAVASPTESAPAVEYDPFLVDAADVQHTLTLKAKLRESYHKLAQSSAHAHQSSKVAITGVAEKVEVYYIEVKEGVVHVVSSINNKMVYIKARICEIAGPSVEKLYENSCTVAASAKAHIEKARGAVEIKLHDGYVYIASTAEGHAVCIKGHVDFMQEKALKVADSYTAPIKSKAVAMSGAAKAKVLESYGIIVEAVETQTRPAVTKAIELTHPIFE